MQELGIGNVVAIATALLGGAAAAIIRLYRDRNAERKRADELQEQLRREHTRDLRHVAGLPTSLQPKPPPPAAPSFHSTELFNIRDVRAQLQRDEEEPPPSTERPPPRKPPRPRR